MDIQKWLNDQNIEAVQDRRGVRGYWMHDNLYTEIDLIELLEAFSLHGVVASLPTTNEAKLKLKQAVENSFKDNEVVEKREYSLGFRHCYNWLKIEQMKSKG